MTNREKFLTVLVVFFMFTSILQTDSENTDLQRRNG